MVEVPEFIRGEPPFDLYFTDHKSLPHKWKNDRITVWMLSTCVVMPYVEYGQWALFPFWWNKADIPEKWTTGEWYPDYEMIYGSQRKHGVIHRMWGTQPLNTYLRGHFAIWDVGTYAWNRNTQFVLIQQYFKGGWWGKGDNAKQIVIKKQLQQNKVGVPLLIELGIIKDDTAVYFMDQSKPEEEIPHGKDPFRLFHGKTCLEEYMKWLPAYLREWRPDDFGIDIDEIIETEVSVVS